MFLEQINPSSWVLSFGNKLRPHNKAHWDPLEGRGPTKGLQPSFSSGRTQLPQFCQDTLSSWGCGQAFPSGFACAKGGILCSSIPICPPLFSVTISSPTQKLIVCFSVNERVGETSVPCLVTFICLGTRLGGLHCPVPVPGCAGPAGSGTRGTRGPPSAPVHPLSAGREVRVHPAHSGHSVPQGGGGGVQEEKPVLSWQGWGRAFELNLCL